MAAAARRRATAVASTISAPIATATSSGERAPIARPIGAWIRPRPGVVDALGAQPLLAVGRRHLAAHRADVDGRRLERGDQGGDVELLVVREHADDGAGVDGRRAEEAVGPLDDELVRLREPLRA